MPAPQRQRVRRDLHHAGAAAFLEHLAQHLLQLRRLGGRPGSVELARADPVADRPDPPALDPRRFEDRREHVGRGRLAVGAGDADERQLLAGIAVEGRRDLGERRARGGHLEPGHGDAGRRGRLRDHRDRAVRDRLRDEPGAVGVDAAQGDEQGAGLHLPRVVGDRGDFSVGRVRHSSRGFRL
jgi:hypothetical protein